MCKKRVKEKKFKRLWKEIKDQQTAPTKYTYISLVLTTSARVCGQEISKCDGSEWCAVRCV